MVENGGNRVRARVSAAEKAEKAVRQAHSRRVSKAKSKQGFDDTAALAFQDELLVACRDIWTRSYDPSIEYGKHGSKPAVTRYGPAAAVSESATNAAVVDCSPGIGAAIAASAATLSVTDWRIRVWESSPPLVQVIFEKMRLQSQFEKIVTPCLIEPFTLPPRLAYLHTYTYVLKVFYARERRDNALAWERYALDQKEQVVITSRIPPVAGCNHEPVTCFP